MSDRHCAMDDDEVLAEEDMREGYMKLTSRGNNFSKGPVVREASWCVQEKGKSRD